MLNNVIYHPDWMFHIWQCVSPYDFSVLHFKCAPGTPYKLCMSIDKRFGIVDRTEKLDIEYVNYLPTEPVSCFASVNVRWATFNCHLYIRAIRKRVRS